MMREDKGDHGVCQASRRGYRPPTGRAAAV